MKKYFTLSLNFQWNEVKNAHKRKITPQRGKKNECNQKVKFVVHSVENSSSFCMNFICSCLTHVNKNSGV